MLSLWEKIFVFMQIFFIVYSSNIAASHRHLCQWQFNSSRYSLINKAKKIYLLSYSFSLKMFSWNNLGFCDFAHLPLPNPNETQMLTLCQGRSRRTVSQKPKYIRCMTQYLFFYLDQYLSCIRDCIRASIVLLLLYDNRLVVSFFQYMLSVGKFSRGKEKGTAV